MSTMVTRAERTGSGTWRRTMDLLIPILVVVAYFALMRFVLPALGIPTCMSGSCGMPAARSAQPVCADEADAPPPAPDKQ
jgi:hypothetical protein